MWKKDQEGKSRSLGQNNFQGGTQKAYCYLRGEGEEREDWMMV